MAIDHVRFETGVKTFFDQGSELFESNSCIFCDKNEDSIELFTKGSMRVVRCRCGFVYNATQPTQACLDRFYAESGAMATWAELKQSFQEKKRQEDKYSRAVDLLASLEIKSLLDLGCGTGKFLSLLKAKRPSAHLEGIDPNEASLHVAREAGLKVTQADYKKYFSQHTSTWDAVSLWGVLEHVKDPMGVLFDVSSYLNPGGYVAVCVPNVRSHVVQVTWSDCFTFCPQHLWYFDCDTLSRALEIAGFALLDIYTIEPEAVPFVKAQYGFKPYEALPNWAEAKYLRPEIVAQRAEEIIRFDGGYKLVAIAKKLPFPEYPDEPKGVA